MILLKEAVGQISRSRPGIRSFLALGAGVLAVVLAGYLLLFAVSALPQDSLRQHIREAYAEGYFSSSYPKPRQPFRAIGKKSDMYTECVGIGIAANLEPDPVTLLSMPTFGECGGLTRAVESGFTLKPHPYMRYTHGYQIALKPLYTFFSIDTVQKIGSGVTVGLLLLLFITLRRHLNTGYAAVVTLSFFLTRSSSAFLLVTHASQLWFVLLAAAAAVRFRNNCSPLVLFGVIGSGDAILSFLSMGSLSLGLPMLCYTLTLWKDGKKSGEIFGAVFWGGIGWSIGFVLPWLIKWGVLAATLHPTSSQLFGETLQRYPTGSIQRIFIAMRENIISLQWRACLILLALFSARKLFRRPACPKGLWVVIFPALVPIIWVSILPGQSGIWHSFFINVILWPALAAIYLLLLSMPRPESR